MLNPSFGSLGGTSASWQGELIRLPEELVLELAEPQLFLLEVANSVWGYISF